jgi:hypothetical protein
MTNVSRSCRWLSALVLALVGIVARTNAWETLGTFPNSAQCSAAAQGHCAGYCEVRELTCAQPSVKWLWWELNSSKPGLCEIDTWACS